MTSENDVLKDKVKELLNDIEQNPEGDVVPDATAGPKPKAPVDPAIKTPPKPETEEVEDALDEGLY